MYRILQRVFGPRHARWVAALCYALLVLLVFWYWAPPDHAFRYLGM